MKNSLLAILIFFFIHPYPVFAESANVITVSPSIIRIDLQTDKPEAALYYKNSSDETVELTFTSSDVAELEDGYKISFLEQKEAKNYKYKLSSWIDFNQKTLLINPHETGKITVFIDKEKLTAGGHYGAVLAHITNHNPHGNVSINGVLSSLIFVRTNTGRENEEGKIEKFAAIRDWIEFPQSFILRFNNTGDIDVTPYGIITIKDMLGRVVAKGILNESSAITLPESIRRYDVEVKKQAFLIPGIYKAELQGHFGKSNKKINTSTTFFSQGSIPFLPTGIALVTIILIFLRAKTLRF